MNNQQAKKLAIDKSKVMIEYIENFSADENITGNIPFASRKVATSQQKMSTTIQKIKNHIKIDFYESELNFASIMRKYNSRGNKIAKSTPQNRENKKCKNK